MKLIHSLCFGTAFVNWKATRPNSFLCVVVLMSDPGADPDVLSDHSILAPTWP